MDLTTATPVAEPAAAAVTPEVPAQVEKKPDDASAKFAALAKKERINRLAQHNLKTQAAALAAREKAIADREEQWEKEWNDTPLEALKKRGKTYEDLTKAALNDGKFDPEAQVKSVRSDIEKFRQEQLEKEQKQLEAQKAAQAQAEQEAVDGFKGKISQHIAANKDKYELTALYEADDLVFQTVEEHYIRTSKAGKPKILSVDEACALVEQFWESELDRTAQGSKKFQSKYQAAKQNEVQKQKEQPRSTTTITNEMTSTAPSLLPAHTENDRIKRALAKLS